MSEYKLTLHDSEMVDIAAIIDERGCLLRIKAPDGNVDLRCGSFRMTGQLLRGCRKALQAAVNAKPQPTGSRVGLAYDIELGEKGACDQSDKDFLDALSLGKEAREKARNDASVMVEHEGRRLERVVAPSSQGD